MLRDGSVRVDGALRPKSHRLEAGSVVSAELPGPAGLEAEPVSVPIVYEDEHLLVLDKPAGLVVHPGAGVREGTLVAQLLSLGAASGRIRRQLGVVHRLDRDTSGLLVAARSEAALARRCTRRSDVATSNDRISHSSAGRRGHGRVGSRRRSAATVAIPRGAHWTPSSPAMRLRTSRSSAHGRARVARRPPGDGAGRIRSECTWRRSTSPSRETAVRRPWRPRAREAVSARAPTPLPASAARRTDRRRVSAPSDLESALALARRLHSPTSLDPDHPGDPAEAGVAAS